MASLALVLALAAAPADPDRVRAALPELERYIARTMQETKVPALAIAIVHGDQVIYLKGFGTRTVGKSETVGPDTVFQLASMSKPISATVVASLVGRGEVSWDSRISDLMPEFALSQPYPTEQVTVRDLFCHRSGLPGGSGNDLEVMGYDQAEILHRLRFVPPGSSFRSAYSYSNFGITAGGVAAVRPTGKSWPDVAQDRLFGPLGMTRTSYRYADLLKHEDRATLHSWYEGRWQALALREPDAQNVAGGASSTVRDMAQWVRLELGYGKLGGRPLIAPAALAETHQPQIMRGINPITGRPGFYGLGWNVDYDTDGSVMWDHAGAFSVGARTLVALRPGSDLGVVVLCNAFPSGLPEAVSYTFFDLVKTGKPSQDWLKLWDGLYGQIASGFLAVKAQYANPPALPVGSNAMYVGTYASDYLGRVEISEADGGLVLRYGPKGMTLPLKPYARDTFVYYPDPETPDIPGGVIFTLGSDGKAASLVLDDKNPSGAGVLTRVP